MSAGTFTISRYQTDKGGIMPIRVQPETLTLNIGGATNDPPAGAADDAYGSARVGGGKFQAGVKARYVRVKFVGAPPTGYKADSPITLPILDPTFHASISKGDTGTYLATPVVVTGVPQPESRA